MPNFIRNCSLLLLLVLVSFPALADNGLSSLSLAFERLLLLLLWFLSSLTLLIISLYRFRKRKTPAPALLVYFSSASLIGLYILGFTHFMGDHGSLIFDDSIDTMDRDSAIAGYYTYIVTGCILFVLIVAFGIYHWRASGKSMNN